MAKNIKKIKITQVRSIIDRPKDQKRTIEALGLGRPNYFKIHTDNAQIRGMVNKVSHLVKIEDYGDQTDNTKVAKAEAGKIKDKVEKPEAKTEKAKDKVKEPEAETGKVKDQAEEPEVKTEKKSKAKSEKANDQDEDEA